MFSKYLDIINIANEKNLKLMTINWNGRGLNFFPGEIYLCKAK